MLSSRHNTDTKYHTQLRVCVIQTVFFNLIQVYRFSRTDDNYQRGTLTADDLITTILASHCLRF